MTLLFPKDVKNIIYPNGKQAMALRGHQEDISDISSNSENTGNFLMLVQQIAQYNPILQEHLNNPLSKNYTYLSPLSQNELIKVIGINTLQS